MAIGCSFRQIYFCRIWKCKKTRREEKRKKKTKAAFSSSLKIKASFILRIVLSIFYIRPFKWQAVINRKQKLFATHATGSSLTATFQTCIPIWLHYSCYFLSSLDIF